MFNAAYDEYPQEPAGLYSEEDYLPWDYPTSSHDAYTHHETAFASEAPNPWLMPYFDNLNYTYAPQLPTSVSGLAPKHFDVSQEVGLPTWSDRSPAFLFGGYNEPVEALYAGDEAGQNIWDLLVDDTAYQASTPELDVSSFSSVSTPIDSASATRLGTPVFTEDPNVWNAVFDTYPQTLEFQEPALDYGLPPDLQQPCAAPILPDPIYLGQGPLDFPTSASSLPASWISSERQSNTGGRRVVARDTRRRALGPYAKKPRVVKSLPPATTEVQTAVSIVPQPVKQCSIEHSEAVQQPTSPSGLEELQPSPPTDQNPVPAAFLLPPRLSAILCTYEGCTSNIPFTGRAAWRKHLSKHHHIRGNSTAGGVCRFPECGEYQADSIMRHVVTRHSGVELGCRQCDATFLREDSLKRHVRCAEGHEWFGGRADVVYFDEMCRA